MKKILLISIFLSSCSILEQKPQPVEIVTIKETVPIYHPPLPMELQLVDIDWEILTPELMAEYLELVEQGKAPRKAYYALSSQDYENLSLNTAEQKRYIKQILTVIEYYRSLDKEEKDTITEKN